MLPETVLYDVDLTLSLPPEVSAVSGINAIAHAAEALYAKNPNPVTSLMADEAIRAFGQALPTIAEYPGDLEARAGAVWGVAGG